MATSLVNGGGLKLRIGGENKGEEWNEGLEGVAKIGKKGL